MSTTALVIGALTVMAGALFASLSIFRRRDRVDPSSEEIVREVRQMRSKMEELSNDLAEALERAERESRRNRLFGELGGSMDIEELLDRLLDAAMEIAGIDAAMVMVERPEGAPAVATRGMSAEEAAHPPTSGATGSLPGTITVSYRYGREHDPADANLIRGGAFLPLVGREVRPVGTLSLFWRDAEFEPNATDLEQAENLAASAIPAIENARRYGEARKLAETDALTGLFNVRFFNETLRREVTRAHRYERRLALILFDLDDFKAINTRLGYLGANRILEQAADRLREAVRSTDVPCRFGGDEFAVIMPESSAGDAEQLFRRVQSAMRGTALGPDDDRLRLSGGIAEVRPGDTPASLIERVNAALARAKSQGKDSAEAEPYAEEGERGR